MEKTGPRHIKWLENSMTLFLECSQKPRRKWEKREQWRSEQKEMPHCGSALAEQDLDIEGRAQYQNEVWCKWGGTARLEGKGPVRQEQERNMDTWGETTSWTALRDKQKSLHLMWMPKLWHWVLEWHDELLKFFQS